MASHCDKSQEKRQQLTNTQKEIKIYATYTRNSGVCHVIYLFPPILSGYVQCNRHRQKFLPKNIHVQISQKKKPSQKSNNKFSNNTANNLPNEFLFKQNFAVELEPLGNRKKKQEQKKLRRMLLLVAIERDA